ncbi:preprotein translocase subunit SecE [Candidatus Peribacteria bacterium]|jgi:preprotein translocase SecE subunit|nr:preprotein translocase subunit SecE [Candidatus Peribacteria bacterium]MBT4021293.1 preprotein translocase subunit SecE [Candidatus Peribacteria bacterium]MBT4241246.1 preprotein translocase subunit SecE [Candidatus Peribacteria bacterium]MBT4474271.1 preprotein translocase subunit SecE [Candidatus Peribacteria bacterium]
MKIIELTMNYFRGAVSELHHVRWPTRKQAVRLSIITIIFTLCTAMAYGVVDFLLGRVVAVAFQFA